MSDYIWPLVPPFVVTDEFGPRVPPGPGASSFHRGIDLSASTGTPVFAAKSGVVTHAGYNGGEGNSVHIDHQDTGLTKFFHNSVLAVSAGEWISQGQLISYAGNTGSSFGAHLHCETHAGGVAVNPRGFLAEHGAGSPEDPIGYPSSTPTPQEPVKDDDMAIYYRTSTPGQEPSKYVEYGSIFIQDGMGPLRGLSSAEWSARVAAKSTGGLEARPVDWDVVSITDLIKRVGVYSTVNGQHDYTTILY